MKSVILQKTQEDSLSARVRNASAWVAEQASHVRINVDKIDGYVSWLLDKYAVINAIDVQTHYITEASPARTASYVFALDSINFGSGYFDAAQQAGVSLEYATIAGNLRNAFLNHRLDTSQKWGQATAEECHDVFCVPQGQAARLDELMQNFATHLQDTGAHVIQDFGGDVLALLTAANGSAARLAEIVGAWNGFRDEALYKGRIIPIYKRAQILAADLHLAFHGKSPAGFGDIGALTIFADNMVPHVLRHDGILDYAPGLSARIDGRTPISSGSEEETELRASSIYTVELMTQAATRQGRGVCAMNIDHILWNRGYEPALYEHPRHHTMTVWY